MTIEEFNKKHFFHGGYCCGNCGYFVSDMLKKDDGEMVSLDSGRCRHPDMEFEKHGVYCNGYCTSFDEASWWGDDESPTAKNLREFILERERKFQEENKK